MQCVVTGGAGFIGGHLAQRLQSSGHDVLVIDNQQQLPPELRGITVDICDSDRLLHIFRNFRPEAVFHLAGIANARVALAEPVKAVQINITGTASVLEAARQTGVQRTILASSCWVYNAMQSDAGTIDENEAFLPTGGGHIYTSTMIARELLAHDFWHLYGLPFTILRYSPVYGSNMWPGLALSSFIRAARAGGPIVVIGDGKQTRMFLYVDDLVEAFIRSLRKEAENQVYNISGPSDVTVNELAEKVSALLGGVKIVHRDDPSRRGELSSSEGSVISHKKVKHDLDWEPHIGIQEGLLRILDINL